MTSVNLKATVVLLVLSFSYEASAVCNGETADVYCASTASSGQVDCSIGLGDRIISEASVTNQISSVPCTLSGTFGFEANSNVLWVIDGCEALFEVCMVPGCVRPTVDVVCDSWSWVYENCPVDLGEPGTLIDMVVIEKRSTSLCKSLGYSTSPPGYPQNQAIDGIYGWEYDRLWVNSGCRATFRGCYSDHVCPGEIVEVRCEGPGYRACSVGSGNKIIESAWVATQESVGTCDLQSGNYLDYTGSEGAYGFQQNILWVSNGCTASFGVCLVPGCSGTETYLNCSSTDGQYEGCAVPGAGQIIYATLENLYSSETCLNQGYTTADQTTGTLGEYGWYYDDLLWVDQGCSGEFKICLLDSNSCQIHGDPHIITNDGRRYTYGGKCTYKMISDTTNALNIYGDFFGCRANRPRVSCLGNMTIEYEGYIIRLERGGKVYVNDSLVTLPYESGDGHVAIYEIPLKNHIKVQLSNGVTIEWDKERTAKINLPIAFLGDTLGLCGTYDFNTLNDFMRPDGIVVNKKNMFAKSWEVPESC